jgi:hypothetical protein
MRKRMKHIRFIMTPWEMKSGDERVRGRESWNPRHSDLTDLRGGSIAKARSNVRIKLENVNGNVEASDLAL